MSSNDQQLVDAILHLKSQLATLTKARDQSQWRYDQLLTQLRDQYGLDSADAALAEADRLDEEAATMEKDIESRLTHIRTTYASLLALADELGRGDGEGGVGNGR